MKKLQIKLKICTFHKRIQILRSCQIVNSNLVYTYTNICRYILILLMQIHYLKMKIK
jgi:hypothetical protein